ncbi:MAG: DEAD/DEAH box helicase [Halarcobacter sp.]
MSFTKLGLNPNILKAIEEQGYTKPTLIQEQAIPKVLEKKDLLAAAQTGTGKTAAFTLPLLEFMSSKPHKKEQKAYIKALILVPTRELALQVFENIQAYSKYLHLKTAVIFGGVGINPQKASLRKGVDIVIATPGRLIDHMSQNTIDLSRVDFLVLDEADRMLDMGFIHDIKKVVAKVPNHRQTLLFSATMPNAIKNLAKTILQEPEFITITKSEITNSKITQTFYVVDEHERDDALIRLYDFKNPDKSIIFCRTKKEVDRLATFLVSQGFSAKGLHGDMEQRQREEAINAFKKGRLEVLIATDVAARGLDVNDVTHVFNYHLPFDSESYVHRIGRTGRAGKDGMAVSIVTPHEFRMLQKIQKATGGKLEAKVIPNVESVKEKKTDTLKSKIIEQKVYDSGIDLVESMKEEYDLSTIAHKLASMLTNTTYVKGSNNIGKSEKDITRLFERMKDDRGGRDSRGRNGGRGRNGQRRSGSRNRSGGNGHSDSSRRRPRRR